MANQTPTVGEIRQAKNQAVGGGRKRCLKGKNCSAACIQAGMECLVEMPESAGLATTRMRDYLKEWRPKELSLSPKPYEPSDYAPIKRLTGEDLVNTAWKLAKKGKKPAQIVKATGYWNHNDLFNKAIKEYRPKPAQNRVVGDDLIKLIRSMPSDIPKSDLIRAAGYIKEDGKLNYMAFYEALLTAKGRQIEGVRESSEEQRAKRYEDAANRVKLSRDEKKALQEYISGGGGGPDGTFQWINEELRAGEDEGKYGAVIKGMDNALNKLPANSDRETFYRGMTFDDWEVGNLYSQLSELRPGDTFYDQGYSSYSASKKQAKQFYGYNEEGVYPQQQVLFVSKNPGLVPINAFAPEGYKGEMEALLPRGVDSTVSWVKNYERPNGGEVLVIGLDYD